ncbi:MAG: hypothetical protein KAR85_03820 [Methanosarcinales archaeon]|nr:hypothetical protein [Methanosarcinales archaeon]
MDLDIRNLHTSTGADVGCEPEANTKVALHQPVCATLSPPPARCSLDRMQYVPPDQGFQSTFSNGL